MKIINLAWKLYFVYYLYISALGLRFVLSTASTNNLADWRSALESVILTLAVFSLAFNIKILPKLLWQNLFYLFLAVWALDFAFALSFFSHFTALNFWFVQNGYFGDMGVLLHQDIYAVAVSLPALLAVFILGYKGNDLVRM